MRRRRAGINLASQFLKNNPMHSRTAIGVVPMVVAPKPRCGLA